MVGENFILNLSCESVPGFISMVSLLIRRQQADFLKIVLLDCFVEIQECCRRNRIKNRFPNWSIDKTLDFYIEKPQRTPEKCQKLYLHEHDAMKRCLTISRCGQKFSKMFELQNQCVEYKFYETYLWRLISKSNAILNALFAATNVWNFKYLHQEALLG